MNKAQLITELAHRLDMPKTQVKRVVEELIRVIGDELCMDHIVKLVGLGEFSTKQRTGRHIQHPSTQETLYIPPHRAVSFSPSSTLRQRLTQN